MRSFKISIEKVLGKLKEVIMERGRGFTSGTKFGKTSLSCFLEGAKACYKKEVLEKVVPWNLCLVGKLEGVSNLEPWVP
ncbi:hypothetical protein AAG906_026064 [Vitis piasezkii]